MKVSLRTANVFRFLAIYLLQLTLFGGFMLILAVGIRGCEG